MNFLRLKQFEAKDFYSFSIPPSGDKSVDILKSSMNLWIVFGPMMVALVLLYGEYPDRSYMPMVLQLTCLWYLLISFIDLIYFFKQINRINELRITLIGTISLFNFGSMFVNVSLVLLLGEEVELSQTLFGSMIEEMQLVNTLYLVLIMIQLICLFFGYVYYFRKIRSGQARAKSPYSKKAKENNQLWMVILPTFTSILFGVLLIIRALHIDFGNSMYFLSIICGAIVIGKVPFYGILYYLKKRYPGKYMEYSYEEE